MTDFMHQEFIKVKVKTNKNLKNMMLSPRQRNLRLNTQNNKDRKKEF